MPSQVATRGGPPRESLPGRPAVRPKSYGERGGNVRGDSVNRRASLYDRVLDKLARSSPGPVAGVIDLLRPSLAQRFGGPLNGQEAPNRAGPRAVRPRSVPGHHRDRDLSRDNDRLSAPAFKSRVVYWPSADSSAETGARRGSVLLASDGAGNRSLRSVGGVRRAGEVATLLGTAQFD